jgi:hypothetical protein
MKMPDWRTAISGIDQPESRPTGLRLARQNTSINRWVVVRRQVLSRGRPIFQTVTRRSSHKLLIDLNFPNGYRPAAVNRSGESGRRENAKGGERRSASQQVGASNRAVAGDFRGLIRDRRMFVS